MNMIFLAAGTLLSAVFVVLSLVGGKYDYLIEPLDDDAFPLKFLYSAGFALSNLGPFRLGGKLGQKLREETNLYYGREFSEFYAQAIYAQSLSFILVCGALFFTVAGLFTDEMGGFFGLLGIVLAALSGYYFLTYTRGKLDDRRDACESEFPNAATKLSLLVNSGLILHEAWRMVAYGKEGVIYDMMRAACDKMENGKSEVDAIHEFGRLSDSDDVNKFSSALIQSIERGGGALPGILDVQASELWGQRRQRLLQKGEKAASALLVPIVLMFVGVILIVMAAAMQSMGL